MPQYKSLNIFLKLMKFVFYSFNILRDNDDISVYIWSLEILLRICWNKGYALWSAQFSAAVSNRWSADHWCSARKFWWSVEKFGHYLQFLCLLYCFIIFWFVFVSPTQDRWQFSPYYVASNSRSTNDDMFVPFLKKVHVSGPRDSKLWV
jgi:hypothetical protein